MLKLTTALTAITIAWSLAVLPANVEAQMIRSATPNFGAATGGAQGGGTIQSPGSNMFSQPLPQPTLAAGGGGGGGGAMGGGAMGGGAMGGGGQQAGVMGGGGLTQTAGTGVAGPFGGGAAAPGGAMGGMGGMMGGMGGMGGMGARGQFGAMNNLFNNQGMNQFGGEQQKRLPTRLRVSFSHPTVSAGVANSSLQQRVGLLSIPGVSVAVAGQVATVRGTVASEDQRRMVARFVSLEPGVTQVDNQLQVREGQAP